MSSNLTPQNTEDGLFQDELKPGTELLHGQYVIEKFLNNGGFGITYLAKDSLLRRVVIKECFPESICRRANSTVRVRSRNQAQTFRTIVDLFIEEARGLARLSHPNIVGVHQVFEDNDTAYMAMDYVEGRDLLAIANGTEKLAPEEIEQIAIKLLDAIGFVHGEGMLHRDISPDNVLLSYENEPVLIDFGAAGETMTQSNSCLGSMRTVKDGYSPQEFYIKDSDQSPSSDLYALAASLYHVISGELPARAQLRMSAIASGEPDPYVSIKEKATGFSAAFFDGIDQALRVFPKDRIQSAAEWRKLIEGRDAPVATRGTVSRPMLAVDHGNPPEDDNTAAAPRPVRAKSKAGRPVSVRATRPLSMSPSAGRDAVSSQAQVARAMAPSNSLSSGQGRYLGVAAIAVIAVVGAGAVFMMGGDAPAEDETLITASETGDGVAGASGSGASTADAAPAVEPRRPEQVPFFLADSSDGDVVVSGAEGSRLSASDTGPNPLAAPARSATATDSRTSDSNVPEEGPSQLIAEAGTSSALSAAQTTELDPVDASATATDILDAQDMPPVISAKSLRFDVEADASDPSIVRSVEGPAAEHLAPGDRLVSVNGFPVDAIADFQRVVDATSEYTVGTVVEVALGIEDAATGTASVQTVALPALHRTMLLNGVVFETGREGDAWVTVVSNGFGAGASDLRTGDRLVALMPANEMLDTEDALLRVLQRELDAGVTQFNFAVTRNDELWMVTMPYATTAIGN